MVEKAKIFVSFFKDLFTNRKMFGELVRNDMKSRYAGNLFGMVWAYIQPLVNLLVMWFVFQYGFRNSPVDDIEFILWYLAANVPWLFFNDAVSASSNCLYEYGYLVKKVKFRTSMLPLVKVFSAGIIHLFLMFFVVFMFEMYGYQPQWMWLQIIYYSFAELCLLAGLSWLIASVAVFMKDFAQLINIIISILFWLTPIFWSPSQMQPGLLNVFKLNPLYYITNGYRESMIYNVPFWENPGLTVYFWCFTAVVIVVGALVYNKLRPHFSDLI